MELDKSKILTINNLLLIKQNTQNITKIQRLYGNSYATTHIHAERANRKVEFFCCYLRTLGKDLVLFNTLSPANFNVRCKKKATAMLNILRPRYNGR